MDKVGLVIIINEHAGTFAYECPEQYILLKKKSLHNFKGRGVIFAG